MIYPTLSIRAGAQKVYEILREVGKAGVTAEDIATRLKLVGDPVLVRKRVHATFTVIRCATRDHEMTVISSAQNKPGAVFRLASTKQPAEPAPEPYRLVRGIRAYDHTVGPEYDSCGARVSLPYIASLHEVRA